MNNLFFTEQDIKAIRERAKKTPEFLQNIEQKVAPLRKKLYIQPTGLATWSHYYMCPKHTVTLSFNYDDPTHHVCPVDNEVLSGEPYDGAWWRMVLSINADACYNEAIAYLATGDLSHFELVKKILLSYAESYPNYEIHGDIPYNKPGRFASQVLCEGLIDIPLAKAYGITKKLFTEKEQNYIEERMLLPSCEHLEKYMTPQLHNHEVCIEAAIGIIGLVTDRKDITDRAVNGKYGLKYQLDHSVLRDGLWFEASIGYHMMALGLFFEFENFARYTEFSLLLDTHYREILKKMLRFPFYMRRFDNIFFKVNDGSGSFLGKEELYEYAYSYFKDEATLHGLRLSYGEKERNGSAYILYGEDNLPECKIPERSTYLADGGSNVAIINGENDRQLMLKASPYGGEHDHYDRLSLGFSAFGKKMSADLGTSAGYGAPLHYAYFKNTATHNTVCIEGENMPPCDTTVNEYKVNEDGSITLDAEIDFSKDFTMPDTFTIKQWCDEAYEGARMHRRIRWEKDFFTDVFTVEGKEGLKKDWIWHTEGELTDAGESEALAGLSDRGPLSILHSACSHRGKGTEVYTYDCGGVYLDIHALAEGFDVIHAKGPNNPSTSDISYLLLRTTEKKGVFVSVFETYKGEKTINNVNITVQNDRVLLLVDYINGNTRDFTFDI